MWAQSLGQEDALEEGMAVHSTVAWEIPQMEEPCQATIHEVTKNQTRLSD